MGFIWPQALYLLILAPIYVLLDLHFEKKKKKDIIPFGNVEVLIEAIAKIKKIDFLRHLPLILKTLLLCTVIFALARPTTTIYTPVRDTKVILLVDVSISMEAQDIEPDRITAAKEAAKQFIKDLPKGIQIGLGLFSGNARIIVNPTLEKIKAISVLDKLNARKLEPGTAIGDAILAGTESLVFDDNFKNKIKNNRILVLVTDGEANVGTDPLFAAVQAKANYITIQAIGIGNPLGTIISGGILTRLDEFTLKEIASLTGGHYFNAENMEKLKEIYKEIRKTIKLIPQKSEVTFIAVIIALVILLFLQFLKWGKFRLV